MTEYHEQTSASDRIEAARKVLARFWNPDDLAEMEIQGELVHALEALITPPATSETEEQIAERVIRPFCATIWNDSVNETSLDAAIESGQIEGGEVLAIAAAAVRAGIQSAHETWEPEVAMRPSQEQMLRWLGVSHYDRTEYGAPGSIGIHEQHIEKEED